MNRASKLTIGIATVWLTVLGGGWVCAVFDYDAKANRFTPGTEAGTPQPANDAKCGFACHVLAQSRDYVFTEYGNR